MSNQYQTDNLLDYGIYREELAIQRNFMTRVYGWMTIGLLVTALVALATAMFGKVLLSNGTFTIAIILQLVMALGLSFLINKIPAVVAGILFVAYSAVTGFVFSVILLAYTATSVAGTFAITAGMFGAMSVIGYTTKKDLSSMGSFLMMALIGLIIASIVNFFMASSALYWLITYAGVIIFTLLTAYDTQKIKRSYADGEYGSETYNKTAIYGAFQLYLDFINLFIYLLRILAVRRD